jgi:MFS family permease
LFFSTGIFLVLTRCLTDTQFLDWGWRIPFLSSIPLILLGLYVRLRLSETPEFQRAARRGELVEAPLLAVLKQYLRPLLLGTVAATAVFVIFYLMTVFSVSWATAKLGMARASLLGIQMVGAAIFAAMIPVSTALAGRFGCRSMLAFATVAIVLFGACFSGMFGSADFVRLLVFCCVGLGLVGLAYGPLGTLLAQLFPVEIRYTGASLAFSLAGILGASCAPYIATSLADRFGLAAAGYYLSGMGLLALGALYLIQRPSQVVGGGLTSSHRANRLWS